MNEAWISPSAGRAVVAAEDGFFLLEACRPSPPQECPPGRLQNMLQLSSEVIQMPAGSFPFPKVQHSLDASWRIQSALTMILTALDQELTEDLRTEAAQVAEDLLAEEETRKGVRHRLLAVPLPEIADITGAPLGKVAGRLVTEAQTLKELVLLANSAWERTFFGLFTTGELQSLRRACTLQGGFAALVCALSSDRSAFETWLESLGDPNLSGLLSQWKREAFRHRSSDHSSVDERELQIDQPASFRTHAIVEELVRRGVTLEEARITKSAIQTLAIPKHPVHTTAQSFASLGLSKEILICVRLLGFDHPTPIQAAVIPNAFTGRDLIGLAETGSGKTAAFTLPIADRMARGQRTRGLILSPTREIALQTQAFLELFGGDYGLRSVALIGGVKMGPQIQGLRQRPHIIVATPGRLLDHLEQGTARLDDTNILVLDEADHMLDMGFMPQVNRILERLPSERQTLMFSATMPPPIERLAQRFMKDPERLDFGSEAGAAQGISHRLYLVEPDEKRACLLALLHQELGTTLVFTRRKVDAEWLCGSLEREGHPVERIHSNLSQGQRTQALQGFREDEHRILVATDIAARGTDIPRIHHIINYDMPDTVEDYIHRAGRTARDAQEGIVSTIASWRDKAMIKEIESTLGKELPRCTVPSVAPFVELKSRAMMGGRRGALKVKRR